MLPSLSAVLLLNSSVPLWALYPPPFPFYFFNFFEDPSCWQLSWDMMFLLSILMWGNSLIIEEQLPGHNRDFPHFGKCSSLRPMLCSSSVNSLQEHRERQQMKAELQTCGRRICWTGGNIVFHCCQRPKSIALAYRWSCHPLLGFLRECVCVCACVHVCSSCHFKWELKPLNTGMGWSCSDTALPNLVYRCSEATDKLQTLSLPAE